jgi:hypothetical protein
MSFLYRAAITVTRKQPYLDWANGGDDDGPELTAEVAGDRRTVYLVPPPDKDSDLEDLVDEFWQAIFEEELAAWMTDDESWPSPLTREMFDAWFGIERTDAVVDLTPDEPLTNQEVELSELQYAMQHCAWCDIEIDEGEGRTVGFTLANRDQFAHRAGLTLPLIVNHERVVTGVMPPKDVFEGDAVGDVMFLACTSRCEKLIRKVVPKALRRAGETA